MSKVYWIFREDQRDAVCKGELCPACLRENVVCVGSNCDMMNMNLAFDCKDCGEQWEGY